MNIVMSKWLNKALNERWRRKLETKNLLARLVELFIFPFLKGREGRQRKYWRDKELPYRPVFIIGAPRSGSTLLYQLLVNRFECLYINNFTHIFARALFTGFTLFNRWFRVRRSMPLRSNFGETQEVGWNGPSECARFWYYYLPKEGQPLELTEVTSETKLFYSDYINGLIKKYNKPFVFKNLSNGLRVEFLEETLPQSFYIYIKRAPYYVAQSIYLARKKKGISRKEWWSLRVPDYEKLLGKSQMEIAVAQTYFTEVAINKQVEQLNNSQWISIDYKSVVCNPYETIEKINKKIDLGKAVGNLNKEEIYNGNHSKLSQKEIEELEHYLRKYYGEEAKFK
jgi:hypothetical protein